MKFQGDISYRNIIVAKFQCPKFQKRGINKKKYHIPDNIRNATHRTDQLSGRSQVIGQFRL